MWNVREGQKGPIEMERCLGRDGSIGVSKEGMRSRDGWK